MTTVQAPAQSDTVPNVRVARTAGLIYLCFVVIGVLGFLVVRPQVVVAGDPAATLTAVRSAELLAGVSVALELGIVLAQALAALWLFRLFHSVSSVMASAVLAFGMVNAVMILVSAAMLTTMRTAALEPSLGAQAETIVGAATSVSESLWAVCALFFGLWLIPLGLLVLRSGWAPPALGWLLVTGGLGYTLSTFAAALLPEQTVLSEALRLPANVGEFWLAGYLVILGARPRLRG